MLRRRCLVYVCVIRERKKYLVFFICNKIIGFYEINLIE